MIKRKYPFLTFIIISILISSMIIVKGYTNKNPLPMFGYPAFNIEDNIMIAAEYPTIMTVCNTTDLTDFQKANDCYGMYVDLIGTEIIYPYCFGDSLQIVTTNATTNDNLIIEFLEPNDVYAPEYVGFYIVNDVKTYHIYPDNFDEHQQLFVQGNYLFLEVREENNDFAILMIDITDKANPTKVTHYKHGSNDIYDYAIYENTMIIAIDDIENIRLVDITNKSTPIDLVNSYSVPYTYSCSLEVKDNLLFAYDDTTIHVFEIINSSNLELLYKLEIDPMEYENIRRVIFYEDYLIAIHNSKISIFDLITPSNTTVSEITFEGPGFISYYFGLIDNSRLYVSLFNEIEQYTLAIYDLADIFTPELLWPTSYSTPVPITTATIISSILFVIGVIVYSRKRSKQLAY
ncbi:MAG: hypothetical protein FK733_14585 [Asgard group archaeon]|nr:hypothetical protein [Asgard group archaeon]